MDLCSNLLFPFSWAIGSLNKNNRLMELSVKYAKQVRCGEIPAKIRRLAERLSFPIKDFSSNYILQGAIEFSKRYCDMRLCKLCPLEKYAE